MMGHNHAVMGAAVYAALMAPAPIGLGLGELAPAQLGLGALLAAGAALLPDWDHPQATIAHSLPPLSNLAARGISSISHGHRKGTHTLLGLLVAILLSWGLGSLVIDVAAEPAAIGAGLMACFLVTLAAKALRFLPRAGFISNWVLGLAAGFLVAKTPDLPLWWLPAAVGIGYAVHLIGDALTAGMIQPLLPFSDVRLGAPVLGATGSLREHVLGAGFTLYVLLGVYVTSKPLVVALI